MKSFAVSLVLFFVMISAVIVNFFYINNTANEFYRRMDALPDVGDDGCTEATAELRDFWEERVNYVGLSVSYTITDRLSEQTAALSAAASAKDLYGYRTALALLRDAVGDMRRLEQISIGNIL